jgi:threonine dehydratase
MVRGAARFVQVSDQATEQAMRCLRQTTHHMPEPAGAIALACLLADTARPDGAVAATIMTGGNCDRELVQRIVAEP